MEKNRDHLLETAKTAPDRIKGNKESKVLHVDDALLIWIKQKLVQGAQLNGPQLMTKAASLAKELNLQKAGFADLSFGISCILKDSMGRKKNNFKSANRQRDTELPALLNVYEAECIYNADETGLYFGVFPDRGYTVAIDKLSGVKKASKDNMMGTDKRPLFVIGR